MCILIVCFLGDAIKLRIKLSVLIKPFSHMSKIVRTKLKYLKNEKSFQGKQKALFIIFERLYLKQIQQTFLEGEGMTFGTSFFSKI